MNTIAVLITCHNRREKTIACLKALYSCEIPMSHEINIFLVDDGSTDGTNDAIKKNFPMVNIILGSGNLFWNRGMHLAWKTAATIKDFDYYLWINDDTILFSDSITQLIEGAIKFENRRIIVGATCTATDRVPNYGGYKFYDERLIPNGRWQDCDFFNGNIVLVPAIVFLKVGFLDNTFHHSLGDIDYGLRALKMGFIHSLSPKYLGTCESHSAEPIWRNRSFPIIDRIKHLYSPLGNNPFECFIFERRHDGMFLAIMRFFSYHLRTILPHLWSKN